jgi:pimeloyl-ACP methyl ester carboxylesterase
MNSIEPFFFGESGKRLFGCYQAPASPVMRNCAVVLCYPFGHEYIQFHRVFRQLAGLLAQAGFPVLRFDLYGCGDSNGDTEEGRVHQWLADIATALGEVHHRCHTTKICLVGLRLGGTLSLIAGAEHENIDGLVLWDPVVIGKSYLDELQLLHREMLGTAHLRSKSDGQSEILGFLLTDEMIADLKAIDLMAGRRKPANNILVIDSHQKPTQGPLSEHLRTLQASVKHLHLPNPHFWTWMEDFSHILVPQQILRAVMSWISEVYA